MPTDNINAFGLVMNAKEIEEREQIEKASCGCYAHPSIKNAGNADVEIENAVSSQDLEDLLIEHGGEIVNADLLTAYELSQARQDGHLAELDGKWFAWVPPKLNCKG